MASHCCVTSPGRRVQAILALTIPALLISTAAEELWYVHENNIVGMSYNVILLQNAHPEFMGSSQDGCTYQFSFSTPLACKNIKPCTAVAAGNEL